MGCIPIVPSHQNKRETKKCSLARFVRPRLQYLPEQMIDHFSVFQQFLKPIHHFFGASFLRITLLLFGNQSFLRNIIFWNNFVVQIWVHHFTTNFKKFQHCPSFYRVTFVTLKLPKRTYYLLTKPVGGGLNVCFPLGNRPCSTTSIIFLNSSDTTDYSTYAYSWVVSGWNITNPHYMYMIVWVCTTCTRVLLLTP